MAHFQPTGPASLTDALMRRTAEMAAPACIVCGKPIAKMVTTYFFKLPREATKAISVGFKIAAVPAKEVGDRDVSAGGGIVDLYVEELPKTRADVQRLVNGAIISSRRSGYPIDHIGSVGVWDGESYRDRFFHADACAIKQGYASAQHGARFTWKQS